MHVASLLSGALALALCSVLIQPAAAVAPCQRDVSRPRKEVRSLTSSEWARYVSALKALKAEMRSTSSGSVSTYDLLVNIHLSNANWVHGYANFFSWHRRYLREVERHCQRILSDTTVMIPYWDWTVDSQAPEKSPIYSSTYFGGNGSGSNRCVTNGQFANWRATFPSSHCLSRQFDGGSRISAWDSEELIASIMASSTTYNDIREQIEGGGHALVHVNTGGDFAQMRSPNDPIFWSHHGFIDKMWNDWQHRNGWSNYWSYNGPNSDGTQAALTDVMRPWSHTVRQILWTENIGYCYEERSGKAPVWLRRRQGDENNQVPSFITVTKASDPVNKPASDDDADSLVGHLTDTLRGATDGQDDTSSDTADTGNALTAADTDISPDDRTNLFKLRYPRPVPTDYLRRNNLDVDKVRQYEAKRRDQCKTLNQMDDYISSCAIANQPTLLQGLTTDPQVKKMYGRANGRVLQVDMTKVDKRNGSQAYKQITDAIRSHFGSYLKSGKSKYMQALRG